MCGLAGMILAPKKRSRREVDQLVESFTRLLICSEHRGPHATGVAWMKADGTYQVEKAPLPAREFVDTWRYAAWADGVDAQSALLMGHTRWPTRGSELNPNNNHPLEVPYPGDGVTGSVLLTHNGHLTGVDRLFTQYQLPRIAQVDSEFLVQLAAKHWALDVLDLRMFLRDLRSIEGRMSAVLVGTSQPETIYLFKGNQPLEVVYHPRDRVLCYASEASILMRALGVSSGWDVIPVPAGRVLVVNPSQLTKIPQLPFTFHGMNTSSALR
jgi:glucosamine 6-phosphate synthetase-like amidotransferase/phosphosugar isomerase protein